jgi:hypothetical protein
MIDRLKYFLFANYGKWLGVKLEPDGMGAAAH